jgi:phosphoglycolate phosphatase
MPLRSPAPCRLFLFDLDGTLVDSSRDIAHSVHCMLERLRLPSVRAAEILAFVGEGSRVLIERTLRAATGRDPDPGAVTRATEIYFEEYAEHLLDSTRLYPGVGDTLQALEWATLGVVTNKLESFTQTILDALGVAERFAIILGGDSTSRRKPDPAPLREAMARTAAAPEETVMVGDSAIDVKAGQAAGAITCGIAGGFRGRSELEEAGCDLIIERIDDLPRHFKKPG